MDTCNESSKISRVTIKTGANTDEYKISWNASLRVVVLRQTYRTEISTLVLNGEIR